MTKKSADSSKKSILIVSLLIFTLLVISFSLSSAAWTKTTPTVGTPSGTNSPPAASSQIVYEGPVQPGTDPATFAKTGTSTPPPAITTPSVPFESIAGTPLGNWVNNKVELWLHTNLADTSATQRGAIGDTMKWLLLFLVIILVYSSLTYASFPESLSLRIVTSVIIGFLSTFLITTSELLTMLNSYTALGVTLGVFFPIMILGFFTIMVSSTANPMGIFLQKIAWVIYSGYLFIKTFGLLVIRRRMDIIASGTTTASSTSGVAWNPLPLSDLSDAARATKNALNKSFADNIVDWVIKVANPIIDPMLPDQETAKILLGAYSSQMLILLLIVSIAIFSIMVLENGEIIKWLLHSKEEAALRSYGSKLKLHKGMLDEESKQLMGK